MPRRYGRWPSRDDVIEYLEEYARRLQLKVRFGVEVRRLERRNSGWLLDTSGGELDARHAVIAAGHDHEPLIPGWPGRDGFRRELIHSSAYRNPEPFRGPAAGNAGQLCGMPAGSAPRSCRGPGRPSHPAADLRRPVGPRHPRAPIGPQTRAKKQHQGVLVDAGFVEALTQGRTEIVSAVQSFDGAEVVLVDGTRLRPDVVVAATGYRRGLEPLVGHLGVLDADGHPTVMAGHTHPNAPGLYFNGYLGTISGGLRHMRRHARAIARAIAREKQRHLIGD